MHYTCIPIFQDNWHLDFIIPDKEKFGYSGSRAIDNGHVTSNAKRKIISLLRSLMVQHTLYPTSEQYITVCNKLVMKYPKLQDPVGNRIVSFKSNHIIYTNVFFYTLTNEGSWKISLRKMPLQIFEDHNTCPPQSDKEFYTNML